MKTNDPILDYESKPRKQYSAFTKKSLIRLWPYLHRSPIVWIALIINTFAAFISVYASSLLDRTSTAPDMALLLLVVTTFTGLAVYVSGSLISWICIAEENTARLMLSDTNTENASLANIDLPIAISTVSFYIAAPAQIASIMVYGGYVLYRSPVAIFYLLVCLALFAYEGIVNSHAYSGMEFFWRDTQALYLLRSIVFIFLLVILQFVSPKEHNFSVLVALMLLITSGHMFFNSVLSFQEDKVSLARVKSAIAGK